MIHSFLSLFPFTVCMFWTAVFLLEWRETNPARRVLTVFMAVCTVLYLCHAVYFNTGAHSMLRAVADGVYVFCNLAVFPLYFIYIYRLTSQKMHARKWLMLAPAVAIALCCCVSFISGLARLESATLVVAKVCFLAQLVPICYIGIKRLKAFDREVNNYFSNTEQRSVIHTRNMMVVLGICALISAVMGIVGRERFLSDDSLLAFPSLFFGIILFVVGYVGQKQVFCANDMIISKLPPRHKQYHKYLSLYLNPQNSQG